MKKLADGEEPVDRVPVVLIPVQVEVALDTVLVEVRNVAIAIGVTPDRARRNCTKHLPLHHPLNSLEVEPNSAPWRTNILYQVSLFFQHKSLPCSKS